MLGRRTSDDIDWKQVKDEVRQRDGNLCVLCRLLTPFEYKQFLKSRPVYIDIVDPAHYESVSGHLGKTYDKDNIYSLCRPMHQRLDSYQSPVTGQHIGRDEHQRWWDRIIEGAKELEKKKELLNGENFIL